MIAIPNMEKPKSCDDCMFEGEDWGCTINLDWKLRTMEEVYKYCPLIEIVRCEECKHFNEETHGCNRNPSVNAWWETDFCSYGERRTDEDS